MEQEQRTGCERCRTWEEDMYWKHFSSMHFFLFLPKDFHHHLVLPPKFAENMKAKLPEKVSLIGPSATVWDIKLKKTDNIQFCGDGWTEFVKAHGLKENNLLMFKYEHNSSFRVLIFDPESSCEKEANYFVRQCRHGKAEHEIGKKRAITEALSMETVEDEDTDDSDHNDPEFVVSKRSRNDVSKEPGRSKNPRTVRKGMLAPASQVSREKRMHECSVSQRRSKAQSEKEWEENGASHVAVEKVPENGVVHDVVEKVPEENGAAEEQSHVSVREQNTVENGGGAMETAHSHKSSKKRGRPKKQPLRRSSRKAVSPSDEEPEGDGIVHDVVEQEPEENEAGKEQGQISGREQSTLENEGNVLEAAYSQKSSEKTDSTEKKFSKTYKSNRRAVTEIEKENAFKRAIAAYKGLNEKSFITVMKPSAVYTRFYLNIPAIWVKKHLHLPRRKCKMTFCVSQKTWEVVFYYNSRNEGGLSGYGWKKFALDNNLEESDVCLFKLASQEDDAEMVVDVEIFRVVPETVAPSPVGRCTSTVA